jgi:hypothetical protein
MKVNPSELLNVFISDIPGAVIITADTHNSDEIFVVPGAIGVKTYIGCVEFGAGDDVSLFSDESCEDFDCVEGIMRLSFKKCKAIFNDVPIDGTAWLVIPREKDYVWERIDHLLKFQNEDQHIEEWEESGCNYELSGKEEIERLYHKRLNLRIGEFV